MPTKWYVCSRSSRPFRGSTVLEPAIKRHIPEIPNPDGALWDEAEILGNACVVKVQAPQAVLDVIDADLDFLEIPTDAATVPTNSRIGIRTRLTALGYTLTEVSDTNWAVTQLLALLTIAVGNVVVSAGVVTVAAGRRPAPKTVSDIEQTLPG